MRDQLPTLTPHERALLARFRVDESPQPAVASRVFRRLEADLAAPEASAGPATWWFWARAGLLSVGIAAGTLLVVGGTARVLAPARTPAPLQAEDRAVSPSSPQQIAPATTPPKTPVVDDAAPTAAPELAAPAPAVAVPQPVATKPVAPRPKPQREASAPETVATPNDAAEIAAFAAIKQGKSPSDRLAAIARYRESFARGTFLAEVGVIEIEALCASGRVAEANTRAEAFLARFGDSAYAAIARRGCGEPAK